MTVDVAEWRRRRWLTQKQLADLLGVHAWTVQRWELGTRHAPAFLDLALKYLDGTEEWAPRGEVGALEPGAELEPTPFGTQPDKCFACGTTYTFDDVYACHACNTPIPESVH